MTTVVDNIPVRRSEVLRAYWARPAVDRWALPETVADANGWPMEAVVDHLEALEAMGLVETGKGRLYGSWRVIAEEDLTE